ncbi:cutinase gene palindrome-binding protein [Coniochaeta ligniaria NRRL 30616]|uniref:Cutinase gene palindrome-binding protein n=1 Tax=Coniochaeta ligniaria NRRL 30616 TaxID=1408157 RepID=A0A1J7IYL9_9PEZI|nr:cutinase gene palindrome-binding protein [Coniochaeta ligniaria NRRL 30616]
MSHGMPPPPHDPYGFGNTGLDLHPLGADTTDMLSLIDGTMLNGFDGLPSYMTLDSADDSMMSPPFPTASSAAQTPSTLVPAGLHNLGSPEDARNVPGAGPVPATSFASPPGLPAGNTLTEFTKRRNWPAKVVEELKDVLHILDANGRVKHVSPSVLPLTGFTPEELQDQLLKRYIHPDDVGVFVAEMNESIATGTPLQIFYRLQKKDGTYAIFEAVGHAHIAAAKYAPNPSNQSAFCQAVFMMARPYPTKNTGLLDSFLEHKIENERLQRRIAGLRREEAEDAEESQRTWGHSQPGGSEMGASVDTFQTGQTATPMYLGSGVDNSMPPPQKPASSNSALTRENLEGVAGSRPDSIREKMARYEGATHADTIEMLTGLRYQEGERSKGITTGNASPTLIKGDAGIAIPVDRDPRTGEKKKKLKVAEEYVCTDCGTLDSPEWRKGPSGPKTLCNACGLRWAKKEKKMKSTNGSGGMMDHTT